MIQGKTVVEDVIMTKAKGVETKRGDSKIPDKKDPSIPEISSSRD